MGKDKKNTHNNFIVIRFKIRGTNFWTLVHGGREVNFSNSWKIPKNTYEEGQKEDA